MTCIRRLHERCCAYCSLFRSCSFRLVASALAGFHSDSLAVTQFSRAYAKDHMLAYVRDVQRMEGKHKVETLTHQKWSGAELIDTMLSTITGGLASTSAMGAGNVSPTAHMQSAELRVHRSCCEQRLTWLSVRVFLLLSSTDRGRSSRQ